jgi:hypothetical protein
MKRMYISEADARDIYDVYHVYDGLGDGDVRGVHDGPVDCDVFDGLDTVLFITAMLCP